MSEYELIKEGFHGYGYANGMTDKRYSEIKAMATDWRAGSSTTLGSKNIVFSVDKKIFYKYDSSG